GAHRLRDKGCYRRRVRHENWGLRPCRLEVEGRKLHCLECGRHFRERFPGMLPYQRASEAFQKTIFQQHLDGINRSRLGRREKIGAATVERYFRRGLQRQFAEWHPPRCPQVLGIDEHFFTRRKGYATTLCDLKNHKIYDVVLGRSELSLEAYFQRLEGKAEVRVVCMDLAAYCCSLVRLHFPPRSHRGRPLPRHSPHQSSFPGLLARDRQQRRQDRGLLSLMRRHGHNLRTDQQLRLAAYLAAHPVLETIYRFKQRLCYLF